MCDCIMKIFFPRLPRFRSDCFTFVDINEMRAVDKVLKRVETMCVI